MNRLARVLTVLVLVVALIGALGIAVANYAAKNRKTLLPTPTPVSLRPPRVYPPSLVRIDKNPDSITDKPITRVDLLEKGFTTKDDAGNYFLYGVFKTASGKTLVSGVVIEIQEKNGLLLTLIDEYGDKLPVVVELAPDSQKTFSTGAVNIPATLDLSKKVSLSQVSLEALKNTLISQRIVAETESYSTQTGVLKAKVLYVKEVNAISK